MNKLSRLLSLLLLFAALFCFPSVSMADFTKIKIALFDFEQKGNFESEDIGKMIPEWLTTQLVETGRFDIVERRLLKKILDEQNIANSGVVDPSSASQLGRVLGVKTVIAGTVSSYGGVIDINARLIDVETASIRSAESVSTDSPKDLRRLVAELSEKLIQAFPLQGFVIDRTGKKVVLDLGRRSGVRAGMRFLVYVEGKAIKHPKTGEVLDVEKIEMGIVEIKEVKDKTSNAVILKETSKNGIESMKCMVRGLQKDEEERAEEEKRLSEEEAQKRAAEERKIRERMDAEKRAERERLEAERRQEEERLEAERRAAIERAEYERRVQEQLEAEKARELERAEAEKRRSEEERQQAEADRKARQERLEAERQAAIEREKAEAARRKKSYAPLPSF